RAHTNADSEVLHNPLTMLAGVGELSSIGELVLNLFLGPRFKTAVITTNLPMAVDQPIDFGLKNFVVNAGNAPVSAPPERYPSATMLCSTATRCGSPTLTPAPVTGSPIPTDPTANAA
ncbi:uncharacterized protein METZ01_LOCUS411771, partial [marine metagenome]